MRSIWIVWFCLFSCCVGMLGENRCAINVASFNLRYDNEGDGDNSWIHRKEMVTSLVRFHDFDIFGVQEGLIHQVKDVMEEGTYSFVGVGRDDGKEAGEHAAVFYKKDSGE